uniref:HNH nuclease domain-containing protein n=1 Tax=viral metagenome TaxID=1070528 RepID=A0A6C0J0A6_9ZZZZ
MTQVPGLSSLPLDMRQYVERRERPPPGRDSVSQIEQIMLAFGHDVNTARGTAIKFRKDLSEVDKAYLSDLAYIRKNRRRDEQRRLAAIERSDEDDECEDEKEFIRIPLVELPSHLQEHVRNRTRPKTGENMISELELILAHFGHNVNKARGNPISKRTDLTDEEKEYAIEIANLRRNRRAGIGNKRKRDEDDEYKTNRNVHYKQYQEDRRRISQSNLPLMARRTTIALFGNLKRRGLACTVNRDEIESIAQKPCTYCGDEFSGGIDRIDSNKGYIEGNITACCETCNRMKLDYNVNDFYRYCKEIVTFSSTGICSTDVTKRAQTKKRKFQTWMKQAEKRWPVDITKDVFHQLVNSICHYCGVEACNGIDRVDSSAGYSVQNVVPACCICNRMKLDHGKSTFLAHISKINNYKQ